ncbi:MAG: Fe-S cluster assembly ATPase SufC [Candidatus Moraniibacteriota bacterium]|nr:MAG: Fe-S cluster assembly ATPase SufC [Candidatus Moranbacteria bacterium]
MLSIKNLTVAAEDKEILHDISVDFDAGKMYAIMGTNGSGKSTLARTIMGDPSFKKVTGKIILDDIDISEITPNKRAQKGIFLAPQSPLAIPGVTVQQLLRTAMPREKKTSKDLIAEIKKVAKKLDINPGLLTRSLNENFSGGERKKMEILQMILLNPRYIILDEIDTGVDVDALKIITKNIRDFCAQKDKTVILITHYNRIIDQLPIDETLVMHNGNIIECGDAALAKKIDAEGYMLCDCPKRKNCPHHRN